MEIPTKPPEDKETVEPRKRRTVEMDSPLPLAPRVPSEPAALRCCCGSEDCVALKYNSDVLEGVEKDVHMAA